MSTSSRLYRHPAFAASVYTKTVLFQAIPVVLAMLPLLCLVRMCVRHHVDVPFWDQWELVPRLDRMEAGTLTFRDFWGQHNEHRSMFPILVMLALAKISGWNIGFEIAANVLLGIGIFLVFARYLFSTWGPRGGAWRWLLPFTSVLVFSPIQWENWVWGWQMSALMGVFASLLGLYLLSSSRDRRWYFVAALACGVWSTYSFASGMVFWVVGPPGIWLSGAGRRRNRLVAWAIVAAVTMATYFYDYHRPPQPSMLSNFASLHALGALLLYVLTYLGSPVAAYSQHAAAVAGSLLALVFVVLVVSLRGMREDPAFLFPFLVGLQTTGIAVISGLGRAWMGTGQALSSRYCSFSLPMWCAAGALGVLWAHNAIGDRRSRAGSWLTAAVLIAVLASAAASGRLGVRTVSGRNESLRFARRGLIVGKSDALLLMLYPNLTVVREHRAILLKLHLSVFRPSSHPSFPLPGPA